MTRPTCSQMTLVALVRLVRFIGWAALFGSVGVVIGVTVFEALHGPVAGQSIWPTPRMWRYFITSLAMAGGASVLALVIALPATVGLLLARRPWQRGVLLSLAVLPLVSMPSSFAYAWMLLATSRVSWISRLIETIRWNRPGMQVPEAAWVLATWLWPIPALVLVAAFRHVGRRSYQLASLDARPTAAISAGVLPVMRGPLIAALAIVFILAATDSTIPPLMNATQVWSVEMLAQASIASSHDRPAAYMFWQAWPMFATIGLLALAASPGLRRMAAWADEPDAGDTGSLLPSAEGLWWAATLITLMLTILPMAVFCLELANGRDSASRAVATASRTLESAGVATLIVALAAGILSVCIALALLEDRESRSGGLAIFGKAGAGAMIANALLPPELTGTALVTFFSRIARPQDWWSIYDTTPWAWIAAMIARFGFLATIFTRLMNRRVPRELIAAAEADGATPIQRLIHARLPILRRGLAATGILVACLAMSEVAVSVLVQPPRFIGGSLAVAIDSQMHYGRQNETIASALMIMVPAMFVAAVAPMAMRKR